MRLDTARIKNLRVRQEMEIKRYKSLNWIGLEQFTILPTGALRGDSLFNSFYEITPQISQIKYLVLQSDKVSFVL